MANQKTTDRDLLTAAIRSNFVIDIVDVNDSTQDAAGSDFKVPLSDLYQKISNTVFVDSEHGNDTTGAYEYREFKFLTIQKAIEALPTVSGTYYVILTGDFANVEVNLNTWLNAAGATVEFILDGSILRAASGKDIFKKTTGNYLNMRVSGHGNFIQSDAYTVVTNSVTGGTLNIGGFHQDGIVITATSTGEVFVLAAANSLVLSFVNCASVSRLCSSALNAKFYHCDLRSSSAYIAAVAEDIIADSCVISGTSTPLSAVDFNLKSCVIASSAHGLVCAADSQIQLDYCKFITTDEPIDSNTFAIDGAANYCTGTHVDIADVVGTLEVVGYAQNTSNTL